VVLLMGPLLAAQYSINIINVKIYWNSHIIKPTGCTNCKGKNTVRFMKCQRIRWVGHIERMQDTAIPKKMYGKLYARRRRGRPKMRWLDDVSTDLREMGINEWRERARDREAWRRIVKGAKDHPGGL